MFKGVKLPAYSLLMDKQAAIDVVEKANYATVDNDRLCFLHETLRDIASIYPISHTTISKALKDKNLASCRLKNGGYLIVRRLSSNSDED